MDIDVELSTSDFVNELFDGEEGVVYAPYVKGNRFYQQFFQWPKQKDNLIEALTTNDRRDVYLSPSLFSKAIILPTTFKGTRYVWTEFDGKLPEDPPPVEPTIRIQSSDEGYEHWYWRLDHWETDPNKITSITKRLAYHLQADLSAWDYAQILRPPGTLNYKYKEPKKVFVVSSNGQVYNIDVFKEIPEPPSQIDITINKSNLPKIDKLIATYKWTDDAYDLFTKTLTAPKRSTQLTRLTYELIEMGMSNEEIFVLLRDADRRCKKFYNGNVRRNDADKRLLGLISYCRGRKAKQLEITDKSTVYRFNDFLETEIEMKWVIPGILPVAGSGVVFGPSAVGKSTWALRMGIQIACGESEFLGWPIERSQKVMFVSLEMPHDELKFFINQMNLPAAKKAKLQENFFVWPIGHPYPFDTPDQQLEILSKIDQFGIELIIIDSLGVSTYGSINSQDDNKKLFSFLNEDVRGKRGCGYFFVHHPRKPGVNEVKKITDFNDAYGDSYIINNAQTVIMLTPVSVNRVKVSIPKSRLAQDQQSFYLLRTNNRDFIKVEVNRDKPVETEPSNEMRLGRAYLEQRQKESNA